MASEPPSATLSYGTTATGRPVTRVTRLQKNTHLLVCHELYGVEGQVAQHEGAVARIQPAHALLGKDGAHLQGEGRGWVGG